MKRLVDDIGRYPFLAYFLIVILSIAIYFQGGWALYNFLVVIMVMFTFIDFVYKKLEKENYELKKKIETLEKKLNDDSQKPLSGHA